MIIHFKIFEKTYISEEQLNNASDAEKIIINKFKFKLGDYVKYINEEFSNDECFLIMDDEIYEVRGICNDMHNIYSLWLGTTFIGWREEHFLVKAENWEVSAKTYNL